MRHLSRIHLKQFGVRLGISLVIVGSLYVLIFVLGPKWFHNNPPSVQIATLRANLDQIYINENSIVSFNDTSSAAYNNLSGLIQQQSIAVSNLEKSYKSAKEQLSQKQIYAIKSIINKQRQAQSELQNQYNSFSSLLKYDPANDLVGLKPKTEQASIASRISAANSGLKKILSQKISSNFINAVNKTTSCLRGIQQASKTLSKHKFTTKVNLCEQKYVKLRFLAVDQIVRQGFPQNLRQFMKQKVPELLEKLD